MKILATDLDGTLFYPAKVRTAIPKKNVQFVQKWIDEGNKLLLVSSRSRQFIDTLQKEINRPFDYLACTGSQIFSDGNLVHEVYLPNKKLKEVLDLIQKEYKPTGFLITTDSYPCIAKSLKSSGKFVIFLYRIWHKFQFKRQEPSILDNNLFDKELEKGKILKAMIFYGFGRSKKKLTKELNKKFRNDYPELEFSWTRIINEITPYRCNKGFAIEKYCELNHYDKNDVIVVGDSGNDITMFSIFYENSYCMRKAYTSVRKYAKHTVSKVYHLDDVLKGEK